jgi:hypothetical protein
VSSVVIARRILVIRGHKALLADFVFQLNRQERDEVVANCDHLERLKFAPTMPYAFMEHGALMAASVLNSPRAVQVSLYVMRAFVAMRDAMSAHKDLDRRIKELEAKYDKQFRVVFDAIRELIQPPVPEKRRRIGFV